MFMYFLLGIVIVIVIIFVSIFVRKETMLFFAGIVLLFALAFALGEGIHLVVDFFKLQ